VYAYLIFLNTKDLVLQSRIYVPRRFGSGDPICH
jgi:hypothetical protein